MNGFAAIEHADEFLNFESQPLSVVPDMLDCNFTAKRGKLLGALSVAAETAGYFKLIARANSLGHLRRAGAKGTERQRVDGKLLQQLEERASSRHEVSHRVHPT